MKKNLICLLLVFAMMFSVLPANANAAAVDDYTQWKQYDPEWNQAEAWTRQEYPGATIHTMGGAGCLVTSIAMLLRHHKVIAENSISEFKGTHFSLPTRGDGRHPGHCTAYIRTTIEVLPPYSTSRLQDFRAVNSLRSDVTAMNSI